MSEYKVLKQGTNWKGFGIEVNGIEVFTSIIAHNEKKSISFFPFLDYRRKAKNWFRKPSFEKAQEEWINGCIQAIEKELT